MCEFTGLDFEMEINEHYFEVTDVVGKLFSSIFQGLHDTLGTLAPSIQAVLLQIHGGQVHRSCRPWWYEK